MRTVLFRSVVALLVPIISVHAQQPQQQKPLEIYFIDTEGGQATLFVYFMTGAETCFYPPQEGI